MSIQTDLKILEFLKNIKLAFNSGTFNKLKISRPTNKNDELREVIVRSVEIKNTTQLSFIYHYKIKDITKNFDIDEGIVQIKKLLGTKFKNFVLFTTDNDIRLSYNKKMKTNINYGKPTFSSCFTKNHNREKNYFIKIENNQYLKELGIVTLNNQIAKDMGSKYKQMAKFIEILDSIIKDSNISESKKVNAVDMGCGKGYLTFAVYDHLLNNLKFNAQVTGIEMKENLVDFCNLVAEKSNFNNLKFIKSTINDSSIKNVDILIALHACDTATDDAIFKGICANCSIIALSPCCHKQIRRELNVTNEFSDIVKYGILKERIAEIVTDTMRGLVLEAYGYKTQIFEFISDEHTHKNLMIVGIKKGNKKFDNLFIKKIKNIKKIFGIENFYLENILSKIKKE